jgi:hypothetical protein
LRLVRKLKVSKLDGSLGTALSRRPETGARLPQVSARYNQHCGGTALTPVAPEPRPQHIVKESCVISWPEVRMQFAKRVYRVAGVYGVVVIVPMYFLEAKIAHDTPPAITHPEYYYGFVGVTLAWQLLFLVLAADPPRYRPMMIPSIAEKVSFGVALLILFHQGRLPLSVLGLGSVDWIFALLFTAAYFTTLRDRPYRSS